MYGVKADSTPNHIEERDTVKRILSTFKDEETQSFDKEIEEVTRIEIYDGDRVTPIRVTLQSPLAAVVILKELFWLKDDKFRAVFINLEELK